jgi:hypothetical protein
MFACVCVHHLKKNKVRVFLLGAEPFIILESRNHCQSSKQSLSFFETQFFHLFFFPMVFKNCVFFLADGAMVVAVEKNIPHCTALRGCWIPHRRTRAHTWGDGRTGAMASDRGDGTAQEPTRAGPLAPLVAPFAFDKKASKAQGSSKFAMWGSLPPSPPQPPFIPSSLPAALPPY